MFIAFIFTGILVGLISTFFGLGGGSVIIPVLYTILPDLAPETVISTSLGVIIINNFLNLFKFKRRRLNPYLKLILPMAFTMIIGAFLGVKITNLLPALYLKRFVAIILILSSIATFLKKAPEDKETNSAISGLRKRKYALSALFSFFAGIIAATTGVGGGIILVPIMIHLIKIPYRLVPVNTNIVVLMGASFAIISHIIQSYDFQHAVSFGPKILMLGPANFSIAIIIAIFAFFSGFLGLKWSQTTKPHWAKQLFAVMLLIAALNILRTTF